MTDKTVNCDGSFVNVNPPLVPRRELTSFARLSFCMTLAR